jgi:hypothetical protein
MAEKIETIGDSTGYSQNDYNLSGYMTLPEYSGSENGDNLLLTRGLENGIEVDGKKLANDQDDATGRLREGTAYNSVINKIHFIKVANDLPAMLNKTNSNKFKKILFKNFTDLCLYSEGAQQYDPDDFLYCKHFGQPISHLITLRRFPTPCTDNIWDKDNQYEPDVARMVTYFNQEVNKLDDIMKFSYNLKWKELQSEMEEMKMEGDQPGLVGNLGAVMQFIDPIMNKDTLRGQNAYNIDPKYDQNKVYGPIDSLTTTNIRDVGLEYSKEFELTFDYELKALNGRTPEFAMKDILANVLAVTYNNAKFWGGSRYWVGKRPSSYLKHFQWMNSGDMSQILNGFNETIQKIKGTIGNLGTAGGRKSSLETLKSIISGAAHLALGKLLDRVGRPGIPLMNSLLSGEPTGFWHVTIGNPYNPMLCIGNLIVTGVDVTFPTDNISLFEFPTKMSFVIKLKPAMPKDRAGIELMFNAGKSRLYFAPKTVKIEKNNNLSSISRKFYGFNTEGIEHLLSEAYDCLPCLTAKIKGKVTSTDIKIIENGKEVTKKVETAGDWIKEFGKVKIEEISTIAENAKEAAKNVAETAAEETESAIDKAKNFASAGEEELRQLRLRAQIDIGDIMHAN